MNAVHSMEAVAIHVTRGNAELVLMVITCRRDRVPCVGRSVVHVMLKDASSVITAIICPTVSVGNVIGNIRTAVIVIMTLALDATPDIT